MRKVILADHAGFCFGVSRAVNEAFLLAHPHEGSKVFTLGELIHNRDVVAKLEENQIQAIDEKELAEVSKEDTVLIRSHGVTKDTLKDVQRQAGKVVNLTCPYVTNIQNKVSEFKEKGYKIIILGDDAHPEVIGINGWCDNEALISKTGEVDFEVPKKVCVVAQTTQKQENWQKLIAKLSETAKEMVAFNTICAATQERQLSTTKLAQEVDAMVVIGGKHSSNSNKLYEISKGHCPNTYFVENAGELKDHLNEMKDFETIGITAGASTPDWIIKEAMELL